MHAIVERMCGLLHDQYFVTKYCWFTGPIPKRAARRNVEIVLQERDRLRDEHGRQLPVFVKISPDLDTHETRKLALRVQDSGCDGLIATNTTTDRTSVRHRFADQDGGLSGKPLFERALRTVKIVREAVGAEYPIIGVGGISNRADAIAMRDAGANLIQVYTALIYRGPALVDELAEALNQ